MNSSVSLVEEHFSLQSTIQPSNVAPLNRCSISNGLRKYLQKDSLWGPGLGSQQPEGDHPMFVYRDSNDRQWDDYLDVYQADASLTAREVHASGLADVKSFGMVSNYLTKGFSVPSFAHDIDTEMELVKGTLSGETDMNAGVAFAFVAITQLRQQIVYI